MLLVPAGRIQRHAHVGARAGKLQARELQHPRAWKKRRAGSQGRLEPGPSLGLRAGKLTRPPTAGQAPCKRCLAKVSL